MQKELNCIKCELLNSKCEEPEKISDLFYFRRCKRELFNQEQAAESMERYFASHPLIENKR